MTPSFAPLASSRFLRLWWHSSWQSKSVLTVTGQELERTADKALHEVW